MYGNYARESVFETNFSVVHSHLFVITETFSQSFFNPNIGHVATWPFHLSYGHLTLIAKKNLEVRVKKFVYNTELDNSVI